MHLGLKLRICDPKTYILYRINQLGRSERNKSDIRGLTHQFTQNKKIHDLDFFYYLITDSHAFNFKKDINNYSLRII